MRGWENERERDREKEVVVGEREGGVGKGREGEGWTYLAGMNAEGSDCVVRQRCWILAVS